MASVRPHPALPDIAALTNVSETQGRIDSFDYIDGYRSRVPHLRAFRVPLGAPLVLGGWALDPTGKLPVGAVAIVIDSARVYAAEAGFSRRDVVVARGHATPEWIGFRTIVPTGGFAAGGHHARAYAQIDGEWFAAGEQYFWLYDIMRPEAGALERAARIEVETVDQLTPQGHLTATGGPVGSDVVAIIRGWAIDIDTRRAAAGVCAIDDAGRHWTAPCDINRPDVRSETAAHDERLGFEIEIPATVLGPGRHILTLQAFDATGTRFARTTTRTLDVAVKPRPFPGFATLVSGEPHCAVRIQETNSRAMLLNGSSELRAKRGAIFELNGWAAMADGSAATDLYFELNQIDAAAIPPTRYFPLAGVQFDGRFRELPNPPCRDGWFAYRLGTENLKRCVYELALAVVNEGRRTFSRKILGTIELE